MDKLTMAHEYAKIIMTAMLDGKLEYRKPHEIANEAFVVLDAMLVENDEREVSVEEMMKDHVHDYIYGRVCACGAVNGAEKEWQPDCSVAPESADYWAMDENGWCNWYSKEHEVIGTQWDWDDVFKSSSSFNYQGNWQDSLRKRPQ